LFCENGNIKTIFNLAKFADNFVKFLANFFFAFAIVMVQEFAYNFVKFLANFFFTFAIVMVQELVCFFVCCLTVHQHDLSH